MNIIGYLPEPELEAAWRAECRSAGWRFRSFGRIGDCLEEAGKRLAEAILIANIGLTFEEWVRTLEAACRCQGAAAVLALIVRGPPGRTTPEERWREAAADRGIPWVEDGESAAGTAREAAVFFGGSGPPEPDSCPDRRTDRLAVFIGSSPNIGTTLVSFGTAVRLALATDCRIGYLCLNLKSSKIHRYLGREDPPVTLDGLRAELRSRTLGPERLARLCETFPALPGLHVLPGNLLREQAEYFTPEDIEHLLDAARTAFELTLVEVNAYWDNAATITGVLCADHRYLVTTPDLSQFQEDINRWVISLAPVLQLRPESFELVVNGYDPPAAAGIQLKDIGRETGMPVRARLTRRPEVGAALNQGRLLELLLGRGAVAGELDVFARLLCRQWGVPTLEKPVRRPGWLMRWLPPAVAGTKGG